MLRGKIRRPVSQVYSAAGNCEKNDGLGVAAWPLFSSFLVWLSLLFSSSSSSFEFVTVYCLDAWRWPHLPAAQHMNDVTMHWNQVTNSGALMLTPSFDISTWFNSIILIR